MKANLMIVVALGLLASQVSAGEPEALKTQKEKTSYGVGVDMARNLRQQGVEVDFDVLGGKCQVMRARLDCDRQAFGPRLTQEIEGIG